MDKSIVIGLLQNTAILLAFSMLYENIWMKNESVVKLSKKIITGFIIGAIGIVIMFTPWKMAPGIVFDTRSVVLSVTGLFFGTIPTGIAMIITATLRIIQGGDGMWMGTAVIFTSGSIGVLWRKLRPFWQKRNYRLELLIMGLIVHAVMSACTIFLPPEKIWDTFSTIALPLIFIYSPATLLLGMLMVNQEKNWKNRLAKEKLRAMEKKFNKIFESGNISGNIVSVILDRKGNITFCNNYLLEITQYAYHELIGKSWIDMLIPEKNRSEMKGFFDQIVSHGNSTSQYENEIITKSGEQLYISWFNLSLESNRLENKGLASIGVNITNRKALEDKLKEKNDEIEAQNEKLIIANRELETAKLKAEESDFVKTAFLQNMSHEIRTPMNAVIGFSGLISKSNLTAEKLKSYVTIISNSAKQLLSIVTDILTISSIDAKQEKLNLIPFNLNNMLEDLHIIFKSQAKNDEISLLLEKGLNESQSEIYADQTKLTQILTNLLGNALKFTEKGFVSFGYQKKIINDNGSEKAEQEILEFFVKDTGIGISKEMASKVFERFRQADLSINKKYGGTGLGLAISKAFAELMGGNIRLESEKGEGSTFYLTIPYQPVNQVIETTTEKMDVLSKKSILIAEDDEYSFLYVEEILSQHEIEIIHAINGQEAINICRSNPDIGLILMDIQMPLMSGHEAAKQIKTFKPELPIIAQTAYALESDMLRFNDNSFDDYLTKPINEDELKQKLSKYLMNS